MPRCLAISLEQTRVVRAAIKRSTALAHGNGPAGRCLASPLRRKMARAVRHIATTAMQPGAETGLALVAVKRTGGSFSASPIRWRAAKPAHRANSGVWSGKAIGNAGRQPRVAKPECGFESRPLHLEAT